MAEVVSSMLSGVTVWLLDFFHNHERQSILLSAELAVEEPLGKFQFKNQLFSNSCSVKYYWIQTSFFPLCWCVIMTNLDYSRFDLFDTKINLFLQTCRFRFRSN